METVETLPDYYTILGVPRHATDEAIRRAYLRKAWQHHPDIHPDDPGTLEAMRSINAAYETLSEPILRARYDSRRTTIHIPPLGAEPLHFRPGDFSPPRVVRRHPSSREPGVLDAAMLLLQRLVRCVSATLPV